MDSTISEKHGSTESEVSQSSKTRKPEQPRELTNWFIAQEGFRYFDADQLAVLKIVGQEEGGKWVRSAPIAQLKFKENVAYTTDGTVWNLGEPDEKWLDFIRQTQEGRDWLEELS